MLVAELVDILFKRYTSIYNGKLVQLSYLKPLMSFVESWNLVVRIKKD